MPKKRAEVITNIMPVDDIILETEDPDMEHIPTGLYSLDMALSGGIPTNSTMEIYGQEKVGKSTLMYYLSGAVGKYLKSTQANILPQIGIADFEGVDPQYLIQRIKSSGYSGKVKLMPLTAGKKALSHEQRLDMLLDYLREDNTAAICLDSVGAVFPMAEAEGKLDEAHVGLRARLMASVMRKVTFNLRNKSTPCAFFLINHIHQVIGGRGSVTTGGKAIHYLAATRVRLWNESGYNQDDGSFCIAGVVEDYKYGPSRRKFNIFVKSDYGVHPGITAVIDCINLGLASKDKTITLNGKSYGYFKSILNSNDPEIFTPFIEALQVEKLIQELDDEEQENDMA